MFSKGWEQDKANPTAFQFRKGHRRQLRKEGKTWCVFCHLIEPSMLWMVSLGDRRHFALAETNWGESCWDKKATPES